MVTITTTGYGDMVPTTFVGKLISFPAMMCGVLLITLPSIIIGRNFTLVWEAMQRYKRQVAANVRESNAVSNDGKNYCTFYDFLVFFLFFLNETLPWGENMFRVYSYFFLTELFVADSRESFESEHSYDSATTRPGYASLGADSILPGQQEMLDRIQTMTQVLKQNQQTMDTLQRILETHQLVPKKSPFEDPVLLSWPSFTSSKAIASNCNWQAFDKGFLPQFYTNLTPPTFISLYARFRFFFLFYISIFVCSLFYFFCCSLDQNNSILSLMQDSSMSDADKGREWWGGV